MPIVYMLRHAQSVANTKGILAGQDDSVELSKEGFKQAKALSPYLSSIKFAKIYSSPLTRCLQTIAPFMQSNQKIDFQISQELIEMDYGVWSGKRLSVLSKDRKWRIVQQKPSTFTFPEGESFRQMRKRVDNLILRLSKEKGPILLVTHGDIIKMILASSLSLPIDRFQSFVAEPASISTINIEKNSATVLQSNYKINHSVIKNFTGNQLGGGNSLANVAKWWRA